jgi:predicted aspartyl protease
VSYSIEFERTFPYYQGAPAAYVRLIGPGGEREVLALVDSGSQYCLFSGSRTLGIGIHLLEGRPIVLSSLGGQVQGYLHWIEIEIQGFRFDVEAIFSLNPIRREILGRHTLFEQVTWGLRESQQEIYFSPKP